MKYIPLWSIPVVVLELVTFESPTDSKIAWGQNDIALILGIIVDELPFEGIPVLYVQKVAECDL